MKVSLTLPECRAEIPAKCRYHGNGSKEYAKMLKNKMFIAADTYGAVKNKLNAFEAYRTLRECQKAYYATDEGLEELHSLLENRKLKGAKREQAFVIYNEATKYRYAYEETLDINILFIPSPPSAYKELPASNGKKDNISSFTHESSLYEVTWHEDNADIIVESNENNITVIGKASSLHEATYKTTQWFNETFDK
jgi:hypothetical protein